MSDIIQSVNDANKDKEELNEENLKKKQTREKYDELMKNVSKVLKYKVDLEVL